MSEKPLPRSLLIDDFKMKLFIRWSMERIKKELKEEDYASDMTLDAMIAATFQEVTDDWFESVVEYIKAKIHMDRDKEANPLDDTTRLKQAIDDLLNGGM